jgi:hypothetical protein
LGVLDLVRDQQTPLEMRRWVRILLRVLPDRMTAPLWMGGISYPGAMSALWRPLLEVNWLQMLLAGAANLGFALWGYRVHGVLQSRGAALRYASHWALTGWFVPLLNFVRPFQFTREIWQASQTSGAGPVSSMVVSCWWGLYLLGCVFNLWTATIVRRNQFEFVMVPLVYVLIGIMVASLAIRIVRRVERAMATTPGGARPR